MDTDTRLPMTVYNCCNLPQEFMNGALAVRGMNEIAQLQSADELVEKGLEARKAKHYRESLELFEKALCADPCFGRALFWAGFCLLPVATDGSGAWMAWLSLALAVNARNFLLNS